MRDLVGVAAACAKDRLLADLRRGQLSEGEKAELVARLTASLSIPREPEDAARNVLTWLLLDYQITKRGA